MSVTEPPRVWVRDSAYAVPGRALRCSWRRCRADPVATEERQRYTYTGMGKFEPRLYFRGWCLTHLGESGWRRLRGDEVQVQVYAGSIAAERGFA